MIFSRHESQSSLRIAWLFAACALSTAAGQPSCPIGAERTGGQLAAHPENFPARALLLSDRDARPPAVLFESSNPIDREVSRKLDESRVAPAPLTTDAEFLRRAMLDLTGQLPTPAAIRLFLADSSPDKRTRLVAQLVDSPAGADRWTFWLATWLQYQDGYLRDQYGLFQYYRRFVAEDRPVSDLARELIGAGSPLVAEQFQRGTFLSSMLTSGGPPSDTADNMLVKSATVFLGMRHYDCLLCHSGRGKLDLVNAWGRRVTRLEANEMAAFFGRTRALNSLGDFYTVQLAEYDGGYPSATTWGNRPKREALPGSPATIAPRYRLSEEAEPATLSGEELRRKFAGYLVADPMFARNVVNRIWRELFGSGLAEPYDGLDPARLDPQVEPPYGWGHQASHPELIEELARSFVEDGYRLRPLIRKIASSTTYQLSHRYGPGWRGEHLALMARHLPRRLQAEEVHDAIRQGLGIAEPYDVSILGKAERAMQLPDTVEPRLFPGVVRFLQSLGRTQRGPAFRPLAGSIPMSLALAADPFVLDNVRLSRAPALRRVAGLVSPEAMIEETYLLFLSRFPSTEEMRLAREGFGRAGTNEAAIEDLAWALINSPSFIFSE